MAETQTQMRKVPRTYRLEARMDTELKVRARAERRNESDVVRDALERYLESPLPADGAPAATGSADIHLVDPAVWLSDRTGRPRSVCRALIAVGRVEVGGRKLELFDVPADRLVGEIEVLAG